MQPVCQLEMFNKYNDLTKRKACCLHYSTGPLQNDLRNAQRVIFKMRVPGVVAGHDCPNYVTLWPLRVVISDDHFRLD